MIRIIQKFSLLALLGALCWAAVKARPASAFDDVTGLMAAGFPSGGTPSVPVPGVRDSSTQMDYTQEVFSRAFKEPARETHCMVCDLETDEGLEAYKAGEGECLRAWQPHRGHEFGCGLGETDRDDLIDYLQTL